MCKSTAIAACRRLLKHLGAPVQMNTVRVCAPCHIQCVLACLCRHGPSALIGQCLDELAEHYPHTKFVRIISTDCIPKVRACQP